MMYKPLHLRDVCLSFSHKTCFEGFSTQICFGDRIAIVGRNGSGKSSLLKVIHGSLEPTEGEVRIPRGVAAGYVPQLIETFDSLSGGERFNRTLTMALSPEPDILLLDEPTNHLDRRNRNSLLRMLGVYKGTLIVVSHDPELLRNCIHTYWHVDNGRVTIFKGDYSDYLSEIQKRRSSIECEKARLVRQKKELHRSLMKEQERAAKSREKGEKSIEQRKWATIVSKAKAGRAGSTSGRKKAAIAEGKEKLNESLMNLRVPEIIVPRFSMNATDIREQVVLSIARGSVGYGGEPLIGEISLALGPRERIAIKGDNGSGKSTLFRAILSDPRVCRTGDWFVREGGKIGYLDQHYGTLQRGKTAIELMSEIVPSWTYLEQRAHLNDFLFRKNEEVNTQIAELSGGEKARLSLALIAANTPRLLILDEITNNLDLETREHVIQVLRDYPGALIVISHDEEFLAEIGVPLGYTIERGTMLHTPMD